MISIVSPMKLFLCICIFRILNALVIQTQFDPDEYWQTLEPAYCKAFVPSSVDKSFPDNCQGLTWEWKRRAVNNRVYSKPSMHFDSSRTITWLFDWISDCFHGPVRSYASVLPTYCLYVISRFLGVDTTWMVAKGPALLHALLFAAPTDFAVWSMARWVTSVPGGGREMTVMWWCLFCSLTSWFNAYALVRTYANSIEAALFALGMMLVSPELIGGSSDISRPGCRSALAFFLGGIGAAIRFTSLVAYVPMGFLLALQKKSFLDATRFLVLNCATFGMLGIGLTMVIDRAMYGFWCIPFLGNFHFNVILGNGSLYGTHPFYWYFSSGIPAIAGLLLPVLLLEFWRTWFLKTKPPSAVNKSISPFSRGRRNLWIIVFCYTLAHSFSGHKEFRFLLPILPVFCVLAGESVGRLLTDPKADTIKQQNRIPNWRRIIAFVSINIVPVFYLGLLHQRAPIEVNKRIVELIPQRRRNGVKGPPQTYSVHYLMACHSTPLLSHLHAPPVKFDTWYLDCSPGCRSDPQEVCESDLFEQHPGMFMEQMYFRCESVEEGVCVTDNRIMYPDFLVTFSGYAPSMKSRISTMGLSEVGRFAHGINGVRIKIPSSQVLMEFGSDAFLSAAYTSISLMFGMVELKLDEMVLYASKDL